MVASDTSSLSDYYTPSRLRPRHRRENSPAAIIGNETAVERKTSSKHFRTDRVNAPESMKRTLKLVRYIGLILILILVLSQDIGEGNGVNIEHMPSSFPNESNHVSPMRLRAGHQSARRRSTDIQRRAEDKNTLLTKDEEERASQITKDMGRRQVKLKPTNGLQMHGNQVSPYEHTLVPNPSSVEIPNNIDQFLRDVADPIEKKDVPFFWHILKSGGTSIKDAIGMCLNLVEASESGVLEGHQSDLLLQKVRIANGKIEYVNVDTTTANGISRAMSMQLIESEMADVIFSPLLHESTSLFDNSSNHRARVFCVFRHPIERAISLFYYLRDADHEPTFSEKLKKIETVEDYAVSEFAENNWMTRFSTNTMTGTLTREHLEKAKEILRRKILVGLTKDMEASFERFMTYFGWNKNQISDGQRACLKQYLFHGSNRNKHDVKPDTVGWSLLKDNNAFDLELYDFVLQLYEDQHKIVL